MPAHQQPFAPPRDSASHTSSPSPLQSPPLQGAMLWLAAIVLVASFVLMLLHFQDKLPGT